MLADTNDVVGSQGPFSARLTVIVAGHAADAGAPRADPVFRIEVKAVRQVEPRNASSIINAVFNVDNFCDGRAKSAFNEWSPFGSLDPCAAVLVVSAGGNSQPGSAGTPSSRPHSFMPDGQALDPPSHPDRARDYAGPETFSVTLTRGINAPAVADPSPRHTQDSLFYAPRWTVGV